MKRYDQGELKPLKKRSNNFIKESIKDEVNNKLVEFINMFKPPRRCEKLYADL